MGKQPLCNDILDHKIVFPFSFKALALMGLDEVNEFICLADNLEYVELQEQDNIVSTV